MVEGVPGIEIQQKYNSRNTEIQKHRNTTAVGEQGYIRMVEGVPIIEIHVFLSSSAGKKKYKWKQDMCTYFCLFCARCIYFICFP